MPDRGTDASAPRSTRLTGSTPPTRSTPLTLVAGAVAGEDLESVASTVAQALGCPISIAIPALGEPVVAPAGALSAGAAAAVAAHAAAVCRGEDPLAPSPIIDAVTVRIGDQVVGIVAAAGGRPDGEEQATARSDAASERRAWLEAAATAALVTALIREADTAGAPGPGEALLTELAAGPPDDLPGFLVRARRLGLDISAGVVAISARAAATAKATSGAVDEHAAGSGALVAQLTRGRVLAVAPIPPADGAGPAGALVDRLRRSGLVVAMSTPRRDLSLLHEAVREAELLAELGSGPEPQPRGQDETYRLLIGVLLRDRGELQQLRDRTITPLADYDARHDTELLVTLRAFLAHDGSTTETAEAMRLHRHTVGYRLARVHEVAGLSPYESDGRERLSLGIKAHQILDAERALQTPDTAAD